MGYSAQGFVKFCGTLMLICLCPADVGDIGTWGAGPAAFPPSAFAVDYGVFPAAQLAPEKPVRRHLGADLRLVETFERAQEFLSDGRVQESLEPFALVAKLADEPLRSQALLKFGYAASILGDPQSTPALTGALHTDVADPEGRDIRTFARKILTSSQKQDILIAPPKSSAKFFPSRISDAARAASPATLWDRINEIEIFRGKGRVSVAVRRYRELLESYPGHPVILNNLALLLADGLDPAEAELLVRRALSAPGAEKYVEYLYDTLGFAVLHQDRAVEAIEHFRHSLAMRETSDRNLHMAAALDRLGQPDAADQYRTRAFALDTTGAAAASMQ